MEMTAEQAIRAMALQAAAEVKLPPLPEALTGADDVPGSWLADEVLSMAQRFEAWITTGNTAEPNPWPDGVIWPPPAV